MSELIEQRSDAWHMERAGLFTGSKFVDVMARNKRTGEPLKAYHDLIWQVVVERMTGKPMEGPVGFALQWGTEVEPFALEAYQLATGNFVAESGFIVHPDYAFAGASPDGLIDEDGGIELKCPKSSIVHLERFVNGMPEEYRPQVQGCMWVTGRKWWQFASYDPRMPESHRLFMVKIDRDEEYIKALEAAVKEAENAAQELYRSLMQKAA